MLVYIAWVYIVYFLVAWVAPRDFLCKDMAGTGWSRLLILFGPDQSLVASISKVPIRLELPEIGKEGSKLDVRRPCRHLCLGYRSWGWKASCSEDIRAILGRGQQTVSGKVWNLALYNVVLSCVGHHLIQALYPIMG